MKKKIITMAVFLMLSMMVFCAVSKATADDSRIGTIDGDGEPEEKGGNPGGSIDGDGEPEEKGGGSGASIDGDGEPEEKGGTSGPVN